MSATDQAKLALLEDWNRRAIWFDGGPELLSHEQMHRHHKTEPYIGCVFCRDQFSQVTAAELARLRAVEEAAREVVDAREAGRFSSRIDEAWGKPVAAIDRLRSALSEPGSEA